MTTDLLVEDILARLQEQAARLVGKREAEEQRQALRRAAEEIAIVSRYALRPDLEPRFF